MLHGQEPPMNLPPPRYVRSRRGRGQWTLNCGLLLFTLVFGGAGVLFAMATTATLCVKWWGTDVPGVITELRVEQGSSRRRGPAHRVGYRYDLHGDSHTGQTTVKREVYHTLAVGQPITVRCLPAAPEWGQQPQIPGEPSFRWLFIVVFTIAWCTFVAFALYLGFVVPRRERRLVVRGSVTVGEIIEQQMERGKTTRYYATYLYEVSADQRLDGGPTETFQGRTQVMGDDYKTAVPGARVTVLFDPHRPKRSLVYEFAAWEVRSG